MSTTNARRWKRCLDSSLAEPIREPTFRELVERAVAADEFLDMLSQTPGAVSERKWSGAEDAVYDTRQALLDHLLNEHGITRSLATKMGVLL